MEDHSVLLPRRDHRQSHSAFRPALHGSPRQRHHRRSQRLTLSDDLPPRSRSGPDQSSSTDRVRQLQCELGTNTCTRRSLSEAPNCRRRKNLHGSLTSADLSVDVSARFSLGRYYEMGGTLLIGLNVEVRPNFVILWPQVLRKRCSSG